MNREELIRTVARQSTLTKAQVEDALDITYNTIVSECGKGESVKLFSGVTFESKFVPAHTAVRPSTQEEITVPDKYKVNVKLTETFKNRVNGID